MPKEAMFYDKIGDMKVLCNLCPRHCKIKDGGFGFCRARKNIGGELFAMTYGLPVSASVDPIEKKPLFHFRQGTKVFSIATTGCNLRCKFCQNWEIAQAEHGDLPVFDMKPKEVVRKAVELGSDGIAYTYTEPTVFYEFCLDCAKLAKEEGLYNIFVTNGMICKEPLKAISHYLDAANIDLKGFTEKYYSEVCGGRLKWVLDGIKNYKKFGVHIEITNLVVPALNDSTSGIRKLCQWVFDNLGPGTPLHFSRFFPDYKLTNLLPTPVETLKRAREIALRIGLRYVYVGNVNNSSFGTTLCPKCRSVVVKRAGYVVTQNNLTKDARCKKCRAKLNFR